MVLSLAFRHGFPPIGFVGVEFWGAAGATPAAVMAISVDGRMVADVAVAVFAVLGPVVVVAIELFRSAAFVL